MRLSEHDTQWSQGNCQMTLINDQVVLAYYVMVTLHSLTKQRSGHNLAFSCCYRK